ncbi:MAG TPA: branched-chain amino acid ABC transporter permease [Chloroflexota bacterium]|nr:branched-chain amino acid ABC transporter permease [Chloroflexota bacterium]
MGGGTLPSWQRANGEALVDLLFGGIVTGILVGGVYALMASGLTLVFGVMDIINVAQGALVILGAYLSYALQQHLHIDPFLSLVITIPAMFLIGIAIEFVAVRRIRANRTMLSILVTFAVALIIEGVLTMLFSPNLVEIHAWYVDKSFLVGSVYVPYIYLFGFLLSIVLLFALYVYLYRTKFGRAIRATVQNRTAAELIGINVNRVDTVTFGIGVSLAATGGMVYGALNTFNPNSAYDLISRLLAIIILGGMGSLSGALVAALAMMVIENVTSLYAPVWEAVVFYLILAIVLLIRPQGIFGRVATRRQ